MTILQSLQSINAYPVPIEAIDKVAINRGLTLTDEANATVLNSKAYRLAEADILLWLSQSPDISQGGQSYSFSEAEKKNFERRANALYKAEGESVVGGGGYGYKGQWL